MKILLVDDEREEREGISFLIRKFRYPLEVVQACNGKEALYILEHQEIDILFTDVRMPVMSGLELVRAVREKQKKIKIVIFSAYAEFEYAKQAVEMNALRYLLKPIEINEFRTLMDDILLSLKQEQKKNKKDRRDWLFKLFTSAKLDEEAEVQIRNAFFPSCESSCRFLNMEFVNNYFEENEEQFLRIVQKYFGEKTEYVTVYPNEA
jgi:two-component system response regulator YesN